jgi:hypothetical protein
MFTPCPRLRFPPSLSSELDGYTPQRHVLPSVPDCQCDGLPRGDVCVCVLVCACVWGVLVCGVCLRVCACAAYIDILNLLQANALHRLRELESSNGSSDLSPADLQAVLDVVLVTLNGVSAGMRNTG